MSESTHALHAIVEARAELERLAADLDKSVTYVEDIERGGAVVWRASVDGQITYSRGRGLEVWGFQNDQTVGGFIYDWPHWKPFHYALTRFQSGDDTPVTVAQDEPYGGVTTFTALRSTAGELLGVSCIMIPSAGALHEDNLVEVTRG